MSTKARSNNSGMVGLKLATARGALYRIDCLNLLARTKDKSVDCVFADPPFNLGKHYGSNKVRDERPSGEYLHWTRRWVSECVRVLKPGGSLFVYHIPKTLIEIGAYLNYFDDMEFRNWIAIKMKNGFPSTNRLHAAHYGMLYYIKRGKRSRFRVLRYPTPTCRHCHGLLRDYGGYIEKYRTNGEDVPLIRIADVWDDVNPNIHHKNRPKSINELPSVIPERIILMATKKDDVILDPFAGGGGTLSMAERHERYWVGSEIGSTVHACTKILNEPRVKKRATVPSRINRLFR
jgi:site-specific DNA-methyltransferase (adenine-specific)